MQDAPHDRTIKNSLTRMLWIMFVFVGLGPLIGLVVFAFGMTVLALAQAPRSGTLLLGPFFLLYGLFFAHLVGAASAALAGAVAGAIYWTTQRRSAWIGPLSGAVALAAAIVYTDLPVPTVDRVDTTSPGWASDTGIFLVFSAVHVLAGTGSWLVARKFLPVSAPLGATA